MLCLSFTATANRSVRQQGSTLAADLDLADWPRVLPVDLDGGRVIACVDRPGDGVPLVLLHGFTDHGLSYAPLLPMLAIGGAADPLFGPDHHHALLAACAAATGHLLAGRGRNPPWQQPDTVAALILGHFAAAA